MPSRCGENTERKILPINFKPNLPMKISFLRTSVLLSLILLAAMACSKKATEETADAEEWPEMDSFHMVMAEAFHPFKDSTNLEPAKKLAEEMAVEAAKWQAAPIPEKVNNDNVKALLEKLKTDTRTFADGASADMTDEDLGKKLTSLHDEFHSIMEAWHGGEHKMEH